MLTSRKLLTRRNLLLTLAVFTIVTLFLLGYDKRRLSITWQFFKRPTEASLPPSYSSYWEAERLLAQHEPPSGSEQTYLYFANHVWGLGWNNFFQEILLLSYVAYRANLTFVFYPWTWRYDEKFSLYNGHLMPSQIPLSAIISGPLVGESYGAGETTPLAVSVDFYKKKCKDKALISSKEVNEPLGSDAPSDAMVDAWVEKLQATESKCIEVDAFTNQVFDWVVFGTPRLLPIWDQLMSSPIITQFNWAPLVLSALRHNSDVIYPITDTSISLPTEDNVPSTYPGMLAVHVRRGDYDVHCNHLANWSSTYMSWNLHTSLPDRFDPPPGGGWGENTPENHAIYQSHCWPDIPRIVARVQEVLQTEDARGVNRVYLMTNGEREWVGQLKDALWEVPGLVQVSSGRDLRLTDEQRYVAQAIDMGIGSRAQVFLGNGFSSMSANMILLRRSRGKSWNSNRFF